MISTKQFFQVLSSSKLKKVLGWGLLAIALLLLILGIKVVSGGSPGQAIADLAFLVGDRYQQWFERQETGHPLLLLVLSFVGGLIASISPCILSLLPVNLSYIGTQEIQSRQEALFKAGSFVLGVVTILSLLGLFSAFAGLVFVKFRGYFHLVVGLVILGMGLQIGGLLRLPGFRWRWGAYPATDQPPRAALHRHLIGPYSVGLTFALISSPCTSPIMVAVLTAATTTGSQLYSTLAMVCYALGYTAIIFLASLFTGLAKQTRGLLAHSQIIIRCASMALILVGGFYLVNGLEWIGATLKWF